MGNARDCFSPFGGLPRGFPEVPRFQREGTPILLLPANRPAAVLSVLIQQLLLACAEHFGKGRHRAIVEKKVLADDLAQGSPPGFCPPPEYSGAWRPVSPVVGVGATGNRRFCGNGESRWNSARRSCD